MPNPMRADDEMLVVAERHELLHDDDAGDDDVGAVRLEAFHAPPAPQRHRLQALTDRHDLRASENGRAQSLAPSAGGPTDAGEAPDRPSQSHEHVALVRRWQQTGHEIADFTAQGTELRRGRWVVPQEAHRRPEGAERKADGLERLTG